MIIILAMWVWFTSPQHVTQYFPFFFSYASKRIFPSVYMLWDVLFPFCGFRPWNVKTSEYALCCAGNVFVIAAILLERNLQNVANYLILSLAVADLLVACLVMPLSAVYEVSKQWTLGPELCDMWTSSDVLCCTASILHLVAIALDR